jgi:acetyl-CoA C-acetyltransferase
MSVYITQVGYTKVGDHWEKSLSDLAFQASQEILKGPEEPDALVVANALGEISSSQGNLGAIIADALDLGSIPSYRLDSGGASGASAVNIAANLIRSGESSTVLVVGVEKMRDLDPARIMLAQGLSENADYAQFFGISFSAMNALLARVYMSQYGVTREKLSAFPAVAHKNASTAQHAQFKKKFSAEDVSRSEVVSDPLRVLDCPPVGDGGASILLVSGAKLSPSRKKESVEILAGASATNTVNFFERKDMLKMNATQEAMKRAMEKAQLSVHDIDLFEIHDSYSVLAALCAESIGLSRPGRACDDAASGKFDLTGEYPISTFGGMKARGYPVGAAGVYQICEAFQQLTGSAGVNQVHNATRALTHNVSGIDSSAFVHILSAGKGETK